MNEICNVALSMSDEELASLSWCEFVEQLDRNRLLIVLMTSSPALNYHWNENNFTIFYATGISSTS